MSYVIELARMLFCRSITRDIRQAVSPREYRYKDCETLCKGCHAREHGLIRPNTGWDFVSEDDLGAVLGECDLCDTSIRYTFLVHHQHWEPMEVGATCYDHLTESTTASEILDLTTKLAGRLKRFVQSKRWERVKIGLKIKQRGILVFIRGDGNKYRVFMNGCRGGQLYKSGDDAKAAVYDAIESGRAHEYLRKKC